MAHRRLMIELTVMKPLPDAVKNNWPDLRDGLNWLEGQCEDVTPDEDTSHWSYEQLDDRFVLHADLAVPKPLPQAMKDHLPQIKSRLKTIANYAESQGEDVNFSVSIHTCRHDENLPCIEKELINA